MRRREFIVLLGGAAAIISPYRVLGQTRDRVPRVGVLMGLLESDPESKTRVEEFQQGLRELGLRDGRDIHIDYRWTTVNPDQAVRNAKELVDLNPDVIVVSSTPGLAALLQETSTIPIVFMTVADPVAQGFIANLARPGRNITGFTPLEFSLGSKWLELLKEIAPQVARVELIFNPDSYIYAAFVHSIEAAAPSLAVQLVASPVRDPSDIEVAINAFTQEPNGGMIVIPDVYTVAHRQRIIALAAEHRVPAVYGFPYFARDGGLVSYGPDPADQYRKAATYVVRILKGEKPADLPVQAPTKFELIINLKTAKALGLDVPLQLQQRADQVIE